MKKLWAFGMVAPVPIILSTIIIGTLQPGYSHASQWISELAANGAPYARWMNLLGIIPFGLSIFLFSLYLLAYMRETRVMTFAFILFSISGILFILAGMFNCDAGCPFPGVSAEAATHNYASFLAFVTGILCQVLVGVHYFIKGFRYSYFLLSILIAATSLLVFYLLGYYGLESLNKGIYQRLFLVAYCFWIFQTASFTRKEGHFRV